VTYLKCAFGVVGEVNVVYTQGLVIVTRQNYLSDEIALDDSLFNPEKK
jgi:hypothetical protein